MAKKKKKKKKKNFNNKNLERNKLLKSGFLMKRTKYSIYAVLFFLVGIILTLSFFDKSGLAGERFRRLFRLIIGEITFALPLFCLIGGLVFLSSKLKKKTPIFLGIFILSLGICAVLGSQNPKEMKGGWLGFLMSQPLLKFFGPIVTNIVFTAVIFVGFLIIFQFLQREKIIVLKFPKKERFSPPPLPQKVQKVEVKEVPEIKKNFQIFPKIKTKTFLPEKKLLPPLDLLEKDRGSPVAGDVKRNIEIIKRTLQNFGISTEMGQVNIGSTVTQYTLRPAPGVKLSKIIALSNNLSLALAAHPIRIEAPIPGKSLVGIEIPNSTRSLVRMRDLISDSAFQNSSSSLTICLGRDVAGNPLYADLGQMPHLLVAGATGTGKTIFLNNLILSLFYENSPQDLRFILVDPKRVEFLVYSDIPHLLCPVIFEPQKTINAVSWLIGEMERRFKQIAEGRTRDILSYNKKYPQDSLPYIVLIIDELADLMMARGREIEVGIVRLAQLARAVGIHLVVATQRPSVEVITGLIKANITSRVSFQVASQVDSRTVLDMAGAEKLLGLGDMLFTSAKSPKPRRIQAPFISEKEVKNVADFVRKSVKPKEDEINGIAESLKEGLEMPSINSGKTFVGGEDPLYEEAKKIVVEAKKASASLLQRRLRIGYARAARLLDILEERGVVGPGEGAKPRKVYVQNEEYQDDEYQNLNDNM